MLRVFTSFSGYDSQCLALDRLVRNHPEFSYELVGWSEIDRYAIAAHNALYPQYADRNYGDIAKIDWLQVPDFDLFTWSSPCFVKGTLVHTERGLIPIEDVRIGDNVLTHKNHYRPVLKVGSRENAPIIKLRGMCFKEILCTPEHPFYTRQRYRYGHDSKRAFRAPVWTKAKDITKDDYLGYAINQKSELPKWNGVELNYWGHYKRVDTLSGQLSTPDFWYVMGRYLGDGWKRSHVQSPGIVICCSSRNTASLIDCLNRLNWHYTKSDERTVTKIHICSKEIANFVDRYGCYAHKKAVDIETMNLPVELLKFFVIGYIDSDGCFTENEFKATFVSERLMYGMQQCVSKVYKCPVRLYHCNRNPITIIEGREVKQRSTYTLVWHTDKRIQDKSFYEDGYVWFPIKEITSTNERATVYNMEVEEDNSYTANGVIVHNCQDISNAGHQKGFEEGTGTRSSLLWEALKAIEIKKPKYALFENVKAITQKKFMPGFIAMQKRLENIGYVNFYQLMNAKDYGVPQSRPRIFMVSIRNDGDNPHFEFPKPFPLEKRLKDVLEESVDESFYLKQEQVDKIVAHCERKQAEGCGFKTNFRDINENGGGTPGQLRRERANVSTIPTLNVVARVNSSQDGVVVNSEGIAPTHTSGHGNQPKVILPPPNNK